MIIGLPMIAGALNTKTGKFGVIFYVPKKQRPNSVDGPSNSASRPGNQYRFVDSGTIFWERTATMRSNIMELEPQSDKLPRDMTAEQYLGNMLVKFQDIKSIHRTQAPPGILRGLLDLQIPYMLHKEVINEVEKINKKANRAKSQSNDIPAGKYTRNHYYSYK
jgi:hypothetical protein